tara:strand:+ start:4147 stop:5229 length:1083 start_codon:yes stop_codon:yes gene_type:complete
MNTHFLSPLVPFLLVALTISTVNAQEGTIETVTGREITIGELESFIALQMDSLHIPGLSVAVINNKSVVYTKNLGVKNFRTKEPVDQNTIFESCSLSKPIFAYFVLELARLGVLDIDTPLYAYFMDKEVDHSNSRYKLLTARMVLNHCSGWPNWRARPNDLLEFKFKPGTRSGYSGEGYLYLKRILAYRLDVTDVKLNDYFQEKIARPLHIGSMGFTWQDSLTDLKAYGHRNGIPTDNGPQGAPDRFNAAGGLHTKAGDFAKFIAALMNTDKNINNELLQLQTSLPPEPDGLYRSLGFPYKLIGGKKRFYHSGNNGDTRSYCHFYRDEGIGIVLFGNCDDLFSSGFAKNILAFLDEEFPY